MYFIIGHYIIKIPILFSFTFDCEYDKRNLCSIALMNERGWLEKEFERLQVAMMNKKEEGKQIIYTLSKVTSAQLIKIKDLIDVVDPEVKMNTEETLDNNILLTISIDDNKLIKNFVDMLTLRTSHRFHSGWGCYLSLKSIDPIDSKIRFKICVAAPLKDWSKFESVLLTTSKMEFKRVKYNYESEELGEDEEEKSGYCLNKKDLFLLNDIQFIHAKVNKYGKFYIELTFPSQKAIEIYKEIQQSPYKQIVFLVDGNIHTKFDREQFEFDNEGKKIKIYCSQSESEEYCSKVKVEEVVLLIKYGRLDIPLKVIKNSEKVNPSFLYQLRVLFYPIFWFEDWLREEMRSAFILSIPTTSGGELKK